MEWDYEDPYSQENVKCAVDLTRKYKELVEGDPQMAALVAKELLAEAKKAPATAKGLRELANKKDMEAIKGGKLSEGDEDEILEKVNSKYDSKSSVNQKKMEEDRFRKE